MTAFTHPDFTLTEAGAEESAAIAAEVAARYGAALPAGGVTVRRAPRGKRANFVYPVWCDKTRQLVYPSGAETYRAEMGRKPHLDRMLAEGAKNRARVAELHARQMTASEIAAAAGMAQSTVNHHLQALGLQALAPHEARVLRLRSMVAEVHDAAAIVAHFGLSARWLVEAARAEDLSIRGIEALMPEARRQRKGISRKGCHDASPRVIATRARRAAIARLLESGPLTKQELAERFGVNLSSINNDLFYLRKQGCNAAVDVKAKRFVGDPAARIDCILKMAAEGATEEQIIAADGGTRQAVYRALRKAGVPPPDCFYRGATPAEIAARRTRVRAAFTAIPPARIVDIARSEGVHRNAILRDLESLGLKQSSGRKART